MRSLRIEDAAEADIGDLYEHGVSKFGLNQADTYHAELYNTFTLLSQFPRMGSTVSSKRYPEAYKFGYGVHIIIYTSDETTLTVHRVFFGGSIYQRYL